MSQGYSQDMGDIQVRTKYWVDSDMQLVNKVLSWDSDMQLVNGVTEHKVLSW